MKNVAPAPQSNPTSINIVRVFEKESMTMAVIDIRMSVRSIFSLLYVSRILPATTRPVIITTAVVVKKRPGFVTPHSTAYSGKKAERAPKTNICRKFTMAGTAIFHSGRKALRTALLRSGAVMLFRPFTFHDREKAHKDKLVQLRKKMVKPYWLKRNMPEEAAIAIARFGASMKYAIP